MNASILFYSLLFALLSTTTFAQSSMDHPQATDPDAINPRTGSPYSWGPGMMDSVAHTMVLIDRLELGFADQVDTQSWAVRAWHGGDYSRWWLKSEGEGEQGATPERAELQLLYGRIVSPYWDLLFGLRQDLQPSSQASVVLGIQGMMPYKIETDANLFLSENGDLSMRAEFGMKWLLTQRWILQPRIELNAAASADPAFSQSAGLNKLDVGLRLRYEVRRECAPYIGWNWERSYGDAVGPGEKAGQHALVLGLRAWF
jgi:copper resistance protein B